MDEKRIQCLSNESQHVPIYLQPFPSNSTRNFKSSTIAILAHFCTFWPPWLRPWNSRGKCYIDGERIQCWSTASQQYPSIFDRLRAIARSFPYPLAFNAPVEGDPLGRSSWFLVAELPDGQATIWCKNIPEKLNPLSRVHARHRRQRDDRQQTERQTDGFAMPLAKRKYHSHVWLKFMI